MGQAVITQGLTEAKLKIAAFVENMDGFLMETSKELGKQTVELARDNAPFDTGALFAGIHYTVSKRGKGIIAIKVSGGSDKVMRGQSPYVKDKFGRVITKVEPTIQYVEAAEEGGKPPFFMRKTYSLTNTRIRSVMTKAITAAIRSVF